MSEAIDRVSAKVVVLIILAIISFVLGLLLGSKMIFAAIPIVAYLTMALLQFAEPHLNVDVVRSVERSQLYEEDSTRVRLLVTNIGKSEIPLLTVMDTVPSELLDKELTKSHFALTLLPAESRSLFYEIRGNVFGVFSLGPVSLRSSDIFGLRESERKVHLLSAVVVLPRMTERLKHIRIKPRRTKPWPGEIAARRVGQGIDNYSIRQYIPGDSFRRVNWKASARSNRESEELLLNEQMAEQGADTIVIVDAREVSNIGQGKASVIARSVHAAITITERLLRDRNRVGLFTVGLSSERIPPGYGRRQYNRLMLSLVKVRPGEFYTFENISRYLKFFYPHLAQVVLVSPLIDESSFVSGAEIARNDYDLLVISPNPIDYSETAQRDKSTLEWKIGRELAEVKRSTNLDLLRKTGAVVVDLKKDDALDYAISNNLRAWSRQMAVSHERSR